MGFRVEVGADFAAIDGGRCRDVGRRQAWVGFRRRARTRARKGRRSRGKGTRAGGRAGGVRRLLI